MISDLVVSEIRVWKQGAHADVLFYCIICKFQYQKQLYSKMGTTQTTPNQSGESTTITHPHLGQISISKNPKFPQTFQKIYTFMDQQTSQQKMRRLNARIKKFSTSDFILQIKGVQLIAKHQMCSNNCDVHVYFQRHVQSLRTILESRFKEKRVFAEQEIYEFVNEVLEALIYLQDNGFKNCHLDKDSIVICENKVKLLDMGIANVSPYQTFLDKMQPIEGFYLAPELLKDLKDRNYEPYVSPKSDIFCLGMIVMQLACMEPLDSYYNYEQSQIDYQSLIHRVSRIVYSVQLKTLIAGMLEFQPELRLGLISAQEKVRKALNLDTITTQGYSAKRSRSSSTKMLKQLLTNSRRTVTASHSENDTKSLTKKPSNSSLTSLASLNSRMSSHTRNQTAQESHYRKQSELYPSRLQTNNLRDLVKNKIQARLVIGQTKSTSGAATTFRKQQKSSNKQNDVSNANIDLNMSVNQVVDNQKSEDLCKQTERYFDNRHRKKNSYQQNFNYQENAKILNQVRNQSFGSSTFLASYQYTKLDYRNDSATPKMNQYLDRINFNREQSIFKMIQQNSNYSSKPSQHNNTTLNVPQFSPVPPITIPKVTQTNSIKRSTPLQTLNPPIHQITQFSQQNSCQPQPQRQIPQIDLQKQSPQQSMSLRVKKSLDKMYKTTQSITSSEEKEQSRLGKVPAQQTGKKNQSNINNLYKKINLSNGYWYEGEVKQDEQGGEVMEGNGILYFSDGRVLYSGSWVKGLYDGFGTSYNLDVYNMRVDMKNFNESTKTWIKYEGQFSKGQRQGFGTIYYVGGQRFSGCMRNGQINGYGCFYNSTNQMTSGIWVNNKLQN